MTSALQGCHPLFCTASGVAAHQHARNTIMEFVQHSCTMVLTRSFISCRVLMSTNQQ